MYACISDVTNTAVVCMLTWDLSMRGCIYLSMHRRGRSHEEGTDGGGEEEEGQQGGHPTSSSGWPDERIKALMGERDRLKVWMHGWIDR